MTPSLLELQYIIFADTPAHSTNGRVIDVKHVVVVYFSPSEVGPEYCTKHRVKAQEVIKTQRCVAERSLKPYKSDERALSDHIDCSWAWLEVDNDAYGVDTDRIVK